MKLAEYIVIAHHIHGNLRLKFSLRILKEADGESLAKMEKLLKEIEGITEVKINKLARSIRISYDKKIFVKEDFETLLQGEITENIRKATGWIQ